MTYKQFLEWEHICMLLQCSLLFKNAVDKQCKHGLLTLHLSFWVNNYSCIVCGRKTMQLDQVPWKLEKNGNQTGTHRMETAKKEKKKPKINSHDTMCHKHQAPIEFVSICNCLTPQYYQKLQKSQFHNDFNSHSYMSWETPDLIAVGVKLDTTEIRYSL
jgi:hypothetical protein